MVEYEEVEEARKRLEELERQPVAKLTVAGVDMMITQLRIREQNFKKKLSLWEYKQGIRKSEDVD